MADVELDPAIQAEVLGLLSRLDELDHYAALGIARDVDRKGVKAAYYARAAKFHTDRHYGRKLGEFKQKLEQVFARITIAHEVLSHRQRRAEYDQYLLERDRTNAYEKLLAAVEGGGAIDALLAADPEPTTSSRGGNPAGTIPELVTWRRATLDARAKPPIVSSHDEDDEDDENDDDERPPSPESPLIVVMPSGPMSAPVSPPVSAPVSPPVSAPTSAARPVESPRVPSIGDESRKRVLASRFGRRTPQPVAAVAPKGPTAEQARAATEGIRQRYLDAKVNALKIHAQRLIFAANEALAKDDFVSAANQYRLALQLSDDPAIRTEFERVNRRAREIMAEAYLKQAKYEEDAGKWKEAAASYEKACEGRPDDATVLERTAHAHRRLGRDLHRAARYAEAAVQKNPSNPAFRVTLGHVYLDAGLVLRAKSELEQAVKLAPDDAHAKQLLAAVKKMAV